MKRNTVVRVAVVGQSGAGKTTTARALQKQYGGDVLSFATPLKKVAADIFGDRLNNEVTRREVLQHLGHWARTFDQNIWVEKLLAKIPESRSCFVDDCRYANEEQALRSKGFVIVRLVTSQQVLQERRPDMTTSQWLHETEVAQGFIRTDLTVSSASPVEQVVSRIEAYLATQEEHTK